MSTDNIVKILGCRGSVPVSGSAFQKYGGATACYAIRLAGQLVVVDAGTGLLHLDEALQGEKSVPIIITHGHADHLLGLPMCPGAFSPEMEFRIYTDCPQALHRLMSPPLWPVSPEKLPARVQLLDLPQHFSIGPIDVTMMSGSHPGGVNLIRLSSDRVSVTMMTDFTLPQQRTVLEEFAKDSNLLLIDGQFAPEEWSERSTFGHNTWEMAAQFGKDCGAKQVRIIHHDPSRIDSSIDAAGAAIAAYGSNIQFGYEEEMILL